MMSESDFRLPMLAARKDSQPLMLNSQSHPAYQPVKLSVKTAVDMKSSKIRAPEKPMSPYMRYARKVGDSVKLAHPEAKAWEVGKIIANMWRDLNDMERQEYINEYEAAKAEYGEQLKQYHNSPQYQSFLTNNSKKKYPVIGQLGGMATSGGSGSSSNAIEPAEEDGIDDSLSSKHVAASRYLRNHRLLNEIFSEYVVADSRSIITMQRMDQLKKQVHSLEMHHEKLKQELNLIEEKFETKKKRILTDSDNFNNELNKLKEFKVSDEHNTNYYNKHYDQLQKQWKEHCDRFLAANAHKLNENELQHQLRESLENLVNVNKNLISVSNPQSVTVVALQVADHPSTTTGGSSTAAPSATSSSNASQLTASQTQPTPTPATAVAQAPVPANYTSHSASTVAPTPHPPAPNPTIANAPASQSQHSATHHQPTPTPQTAHHTPAAPGQVVGHMPAMNAMPTQQTAIYGQMPMPASGQQQQQGMHPMQMHSSQMLQQQMMTHPSQHPNMPGSTQHAPAQQQSQQQGAHSTTQTPQGVVVGQPQVGYMQMQSQGQAGNPQQGQIMIHSQQQQVPQQGQPNPTQHGMMAPPHHPHMMMPQQAMYGQQGPMMQPMMYQYQPTQQAPQQQPGMTPEMMQQGQQAMFQQPQMYNQQQYMQQQQHQVYQMQRGGVVPSYQQQPQGAAGAPRMPMPMNMMQTAPGQAMQMTPQGMMMVNKPQAGGPQAPTQQNQPGAQQQASQGVQNPTGAQQQSQQGQQAPQQAPPPQYMGYMMQPGVQPQYIQQAPGGQPQPGQFQYQPMPPNVGGPPQQGMYNGSAPMYYQNPNNPDYRVKQ